MRKGLDFKQIRQKIKDSCILCAVLVVVVCMMFRVNVYWVVMVENDVSAECVLGCNG